MQPYDYDAVVYNNDIWCIGCLPDRIDEKSDGVEPIFASSEWEYYPVCYQCGKEHNYIVLLGSEL